MPANWTYRHDGEMLQKAAIAVDKITFVVVLLPALLAGVGVAIQEGCLICFEGEGRGGLFEAALNVGIAAAMAWAAYKMFRRFVML